MKWFSGAVSENKKILWKVTFRLLPWLASRAWKYLEGFGTCFFVWILTDWKRARGLDRHHAKRTPKRPAVHWPIVKLYPDTDKYQNHHKHDSQEWRQSPNQHLIQNSIWKSCLRCTVCVYADMKHSFSFLIHLVQFEDSHHPMTWYYLGFL